MIEVSLDGARWEQRVDGVASFTSLFAPGDTLSGAFVIDAEPRGVRVSLVWYTDGKGTDHLRVHWHREYSAGDLELLGAQRRGRFETRFPSAPLTYSGHLLRVCWALRVLVRPTEGKDEVTELPLTLGAVAPIDQWGSE